MCPMTKQANSLLGCVRKSIAGRFWGNSSSTLLSIGETCLESWVQVWTRVKLYEREMDILGYVQWRTTEIIIRQEHLPYKKKLRELELFHLEKRRFGRIFSVCVNNCATCSVFKQGSWTRWSPKGNHSAILYWHHLPKPLWVRKVFIIVI